MIVALKDNDRLVRSRAARSLGKIGVEAKAAVPALIVALKDNDGHVRYSAVVALVNMGEEKEIKGMIPLLIKDLKYYYGESFDMYTPHLILGVVLALQAIGKNSENKAATMPIADLDPVISNLEIALPVLKGIQNKYKNIMYLKLDSETALDSEIASINRSLAHLKKIRQSRN